jgi:hypothetical protein
MKILEAGDFAIWQRRRICRLIRQVAPHSFSFTAPSSSLADIRPAGISDRDYAEIKNMTACWVVEDENTGEEFTAEGGDLLYINEMRVIALMARSKDTQGPDAGMKE